MKKQIKVKTQSRPELRIPTGTFEAEFMSNQPYGTLTIDGKETQVYLGKMEAETLTNPYNGFRVIKRKWVIVEV